MHIFFAMKDGSCVAFFEVPGSPPAIEDTNTPSWVQHLALVVEDEEEQLEKKKALEAAGVEIYSTGGTRRHLEQNGIEVLDVAEYTGFPEMMDGRVKTLHPRIFAGILCRHDHEDDMASLEQHDILSFELVVVNLYPFQSTIACLLYTSPSPRD